MTKILQRIIDSYIIESHDSKPDYPITHVHQVHGIKIESLPITIEPQADGIYAKSSELVKNSLAIKTADCLPVFLMNDKNVLALHAGWKGLLLGILNHSLITNNYFTHAWIGPAIHHCCFEVQSDFIGKFSPQYALIKSKNKLYFDLINFASQELKKVQPHLELIVEGECTSCHNKWHSFRRDKTVQRNWHTIKRINS